MELHPDTGIIETLDQIQEYLIMAIWFGIGGSTIINSYLRKKEIGDEAEISQPKIDSSNKNFDAWFEFVSDYIYELVTTYFFWFRNQEILNHRNSLTNSYNKPLQLRESGSSDRESTSPVYSYGLSTDERNLTKSLGDSQLSILILLPKIFGHLSELVRKIAINSGGEGSSLSAVQKNLITPNSNIRQFMISQMLRPDIVYILIDTNQDERVDLIDRWLQTAVFTSTSTHQVNPAIFSGLVALELALFMRSEMLKIKEVEDGGFD